MKKRIVVTGAGGFIGHHLIKYLKNMDDGNFIIGVDIKLPEFEGTYANEFRLHDLRIKNNIIFEDVDEVYHLAADMGGIGYIETHKADIVHNNLLININTIKSCQEMNVKKFLFSSSACVYPGYLQLDRNVIPLREEEAYPADAEDGYGWEKLMMERICRHFREDFGLKTHIARFHNIYGPLGTYDGGKEKSPAALCRKIAKVQDLDIVEIWGDGKQTRSYCYVDDCVKALYKLMLSDYYEPINIGTDRLISIDKLFDLIMKISGKKLRKEYLLDKPKGVTGRNADISKAKEILNWEPEINLEEGLSKTYLWIKSQLS